MQLPIGCDLKVNVIENGVWPIGRGCIVVLVQLPITESERRFHWLLGSSTTALKVLICYCEPLGQQNVIYAGIYVFRQKSARLACHNYLFTFLMSTHLRIIFFLFLLSLAVAAPAGVVVVAVDKWISDGRMFMKMRETDPTRFPPFSTPSVVLAMARRAFTENRSRWYWISHDNFFLCRVERPLCVL